ncbi:hypothetical protein [Dactylosporangium sp. CA-139066]|uniref:hypothetical protein n=1 Tax=Dactylosporangium sp. CA-139066 TaxID=3239930 RepID=UPI003D8E4F32
MASAEAEPRALLEVLSFSTSVRIPTDPRCRTRRTFYWDNTQPDISITATADRQLAAMGYQRTTGWASLYADTPEHELGNMMGEYTAAVAPLPQSHNAEPDAESAHHPPRLAQHGGERRSVRHFAARLARESLLRNGFREIRGGRSWEKRVE